MSQGSPGWAISAAWLLTSVITMDNRISTVMLLFLTALMHAVLAAPETSEFIRRMLLGN